jgi:hypothetical protein
MLEQSGVDWRTPPHRCTNPLSTSRAKSSHNKNKVDALVTYKKQSSDSSTHLSAQVRNCLVPQAYRITNPEGGQLIHLGQWFAMKFLKPNYRLKIQPRKHDKGLRMLASPIQEGKAARSGGGQESRRSTLAQNSNPLGGKRRRLVSGLRTHTRNAPNYGPFVLNTSVQVGSTVTWAECSGVGTAPPPLALTPGHGIAGHALGGGAGFLLYGASWGDPKLCLSKAGGRGGGRRAEDAIEVDTSKIESFAMPPSA